MNKPLLSFLGVGAVIGLSFAAFKASKVIEAIGKLDYKFLGVKVLPRSNFLDYLSNGVELEIKIQITNSSNEEIPFQGLNLDVFIDSVFAGNFKIADGKPVPKKSNIILNLKTILTPEALTNPILDAILKAVSGKDIKATVKGWIKGLNYQIPVNEDVIINKSLLTNSINQNILTDGRF